jgi:hypothetical protein
VNTPAVFFFWLQPKLLVRDAYHYNRLADTLETTITNWQFALHVFFLGLGRSTVLKLAKKVRPVRREKRDTAVRS